MLCGLPVTSSPKQCHHSEAFDGLLQHEQCAEDCSSVHEALLVKGGVAVITQHGAWSASTRARALQFVGGLEDAFDRVEVFCPDDQPIRMPGRLGQMQYFSNHASRYFSRYSELRGALDSFDSVLVQRGVYALGPGFVVRPVEEFSGRVVLDLDDDLFSITPSMEGKGPLARWLYGPHQVRRLVERADAIVVSTERLADALPPTQASVVVLATIPEVATYQQAANGGEEGLVGWAGTTGGLRYLDPLS